MLRLPVLNTLLYIQFNRTDGLTAFSKNIQIAENRIFRLFGKHRERYTDDRDHMDYWRPGYKYIRAEDIQFIREYSHKGAYNKRVLHKHKAVIDAFYQ